MKIYCIAILLTLTILGFSSPGGGSVAAQQAGVRFSEVQTGSTDSAGQEFIELYNNSPVAINVSGWKIFYLSANSTDWTSPTRSLGVNGSVGAGGYYLLASSGYLTGQADSSFNSTLAQEGGQLRLVDPAGQVQDQIAWGTAAGAISAAPPPGSSIALGGAGFAITASPTPKAANIFQLPPQALSATSAAAQPAVIKITELMPNPAAPQTDANDEFVELYNPTSATVDLTGYKLTSGTKESYKYIISGVTLKPRNYAVIYSKQSHLTLSNTSGQVKLYDPAGNIVDQSGPYSAAQSGQAWALKDGKWQWTNQPTPGAANIITLSAAANTAGKTKASKPAALHSAKTKPATTKNKKVSGANTGNSVGEKLAAANSANKLNPFVLAGLGAAIVLYACYEYRHDLANRLHQFRANRAARRAAGGSA